MKAAPDLRFALHDRLCGVHNTIRTAWRDGRAMGDSQVAELLAEIAGCIDETVRLYSELSAKRWNERAADPLAKVVLAEANKPGATVLLFTKCARPLPAGAIQLGGPALPADEWPRWPTHDEGDDSA